jgi:hypothetical protein
MLEFIEKEVEAAKHAVEALRNLIPHRPTVVMKRHEFERPLDDLGQALDDGELAPGAPPSERPRGA